MALIHLTETFTPSLEDRKFASKRAITEADISKLSSDRLSESARRYIEDTPTAVLEGKTVWKVPISKYDWKNANGRVYEKKLWERVIKEQTDAYQGNIGLADHPGDNDDGKFKESAVVWLNMGLDEANKLVWGECIFVGPNGKLAEEIMEAGGRVGFSSSGFGELSESNKSMVRWDTYQLERPADLVLNPSQGVYGRAGMKVKNESINEDTSGLHEATETKEKETMSIKESESIPQGGIVKLSKADIRSFREQAEGYLEDARGILNPKDRLDELNEIHSYWNEPRMAETAMDLKEKVELEIKSTLAEINHAIQEHVKLKEDFELDNIDSLKEGVKKIAVDTQLFKRDLDEWKSIAEGLADKVQKLQAVLATRPTAEAYGNAMNQIKKVTEQAKNRDAELTTKITELTLKDKKRSLVENKLISELKVLSTEKQAVIDENSALRTVAKGLKIQLTKIAETEEAEQKSLQEASEKEDEIVFRPQGNKPRAFANFNESADVQAYYKDLVRQYGRDILPYKESILNCKTLKEAAQVHLKALSRMGNSGYAKISEALPVEERKKLIEGQTQRRIVEKTTAFESRIPDTWV